MYDLFGRYGAIRQIRLGNAKDTRGTAFVVYEDIYNARTAAEQLNGFNISGRFLVILYYKRDKMVKKNKQLSGGDSTPRGADRQSTTM